MVHVFCYFNAGTHVSPYRLPRTSKRTKTACAAHDFNALFSQQPRATMHDAPRQVQSVRAVVVGRAKDVDDSSAIIR